MKWPFKEKVVRQPNAGGGDEKLKVAIKWADDGFIIGDQKFVTGAIRTFHLKATDLAYRRDVRYLGEDRRSERLAGEARLDRDWIAIAGDDIDKPTQEISLGLIPLPPEETGHVWRASNRLPCIQLGDRWQGRLFFHRGLLAPVGI